MGADCRQYQIMKIAKVLTVGGQNDQAMVDGVTQMASIRGAKHANLDRTHHGMALSSQALGQAVIRAIVIKV
jgi:hypothetical protein